MSKWLASYIRRIAGRIKMYESGFYILVAALSFPSSLYAAEHSTENWLAYFVLAVGVFAMIMAIYTIKREQRKDYDEKKNAFENTESRMTEVKDMMGQMIVGINKLTDEIRQDRIERNKEVKKDGESDNL
jgi:hypothetical protein